MKRKKHFTKAFLAAICIASGLILCSQPAFAASTLNITTGELFIHEDGTYSLSAQGAHLPLAADTLITSNGDLSITLADRSNVTVSSISVTGNLSVKPAGSGSGLLNVLNSTGDFGVNVTKDITVSGAALHANATANGSSGITVKGNVNISAGRLEGEGKSGGIMIDGHAAVSGGALAANTQGPYGLIISGTLQQSAGSISGKAESFGMAAVDGIIISGGTLRGTAKGVGAGSGAGTRGRDASVGFTSPAFGITTYGDITVTGGTVWGYAEAGDIQTIGVYIEEPDCSISVSGGVLVGEAHKGDETSTNPERGTFGVYVIDGGITTSSNSPDEGKLVAMTDSSGILAQPYFCKNGTPAGEGIYDHKYVNFAAINAPESITQSIPSAVWPAESTLLNTAVMYRAGNWEEKTNPATGEPPAPTGFIALSGLGVLCIVICLAAGKRALHKK